MLYDLEKKKMKIGARIREERITSGFKTQSSFAVALELQEESRTSVGNWENGVHLPPFKTLIKMCEIFDCEIGYLLCEYDCKTKEATDIKNVTGLSEKSIDRLIFTKSIEHKCKGNISSDLISFILSNEEFWVKFNEFLPTYIKYKDQFDKSNASVLELDMIKYSLFNMFEGLLNEIYNYSFETSPQKPLSGIDIKFLEKAKMKITKKEQSSVLNSLTVPKNNI